MKLDLGTVIEMVNEIAAEDSIDWGMLSIDENQATKLIALNVLGMYEQEWNTLDAEQREYMIVSTITKLVLENFVLNLKLLGKNS